MAGYANAVRNIAAELGLPVCDYHKYMSRAIQDEVLYNADRVHPNPKGQFVMAKCFLEFQGLNLGEYYEFPEYMKEWREKVKTYRNIWAAEKNIVWQFDLTTEEYISRIKAYVEEFDGDEARQFFVDWGKEYLVTKPNQEKLSDEINHIMEVEFKKR